MEFVNKLVAMESECQPFMSVTMLIMLMEMAATQVVPLNQASNALVDLPPLQTLAAWLSI